MLPVITGKESVGNESYGLRSVALLPMAPTRAIYIGQTFPYNSPGNISAIRLPSRSPQPQLVSPARRFWISLFESLGPLAITRLKRSVGIDTEEGVGNESGDGGVLDDGNGGIPSRQEEEAKQQDINRGQATSWLSHLTTSSLSLASFASLLRRALIICLRAGDAAWPYISKLHLAAFYLFGIYYTFPQRMTRITLQTTRKSNGGPATRTWMIGVILVMHILAMLIVDIKSSAREYSRKLAEEQEREKLKEMDKKDKERKNGEISQENGVGEDEDGKHANEGEEEESKEVKDTRAETMCSVCTCPSTEATATPCGHVYCWQCIQMALSVKQECPICKRGCQFKHLVRLFQFR